jgi:hypothetical protein
VGGWVAGGRGVAVAIGLGVWVSVIVDGITAAGSSSVGVAGRGVRVDVGLACGESGVVEGLRIKDGVFVNAGSANQILALAHSHPPKNKNKLMAATRVVIKPQMARFLRTGDLGSALISGGRGAAKLRMNTGQLRCAGTPLLLPDRFLSLSGYSDFWA